MPRNKPTRLTISVGRKPMLFRRVAEGWEVDVLGHTLQFRSMPRSHYTKWDVFLAEHPIATGGCMVQALMAAMDHLESQPAPGD